MVQERMAIVSVLVWGRVAFVPALVWEMERPRHLKVCRQRKG